MKIIFLFTDFLILHKIRIIPRSITRVVTPRNASVWYIGKNGGVIGDKCGAMAATKILRGARAAQCRCFMLCV